MEKQSVWHPSHRALPQIIVTIAEIIILTFSILIIYGVNTFYSFGSFINFILFFILQAIFAFVILKLMRLYFKFKPGIYFLKRKPQIYDTYLSYFYLYYLHLGLLWSVNFPGFIVRNIIYKYAGCKKSKSNILNGAKVFDPLFFEVGDNTVIGGESLILGHALSLVNGEPAFILGKVVIGKNSLIGVRTIIMPDVIIGDNSVIQGNSFVPMYTRIPSNEIWGGNPVSKIGENKKL
jgi:acetyltransferase-like isoleucine patch superfamily enzyme